MPASKRALRAATHGGGDLPRDPSMLRKNRSEAPEAPETPTQLELVPEPPAEPEVAPEPTQEVQGGIVITAKSCKLKESKGKSRQGKDPVYRSCTGKGQDGTTYWFGIELSDPELEKGAQYVVWGKTRKPFGDGKDPLTPIDVTKILPYDQVVAETSQVSTPAVDGDLNKAIAALVAEHGSYEVLRAVAETLK